MTAHSRERATWRERALRVVRLVLLWLVVLGLAAMAFVTWQIEGRYSRSGCPPAEQEAVTCLGGLEPSSLTLELAGNGKRLACQLHPVALARAASAPTVGERICIEARVQTRWDELTQLDARLFMPIYGLFSLLLAAWIALQSQTVVSLHGVGYRSALAIAASTVLLLVLDGFENSQAMALLIDAERGPLTAPHYATLDAIATKARWASLYKWAATAVWAATLSWGLAEWQRATHRLQRWPRRAAIVMSALAAITFAAAVVFASISGQLAGPVHALQAGFALAFLAMGATAIAVWATPTAVVASKHDSECPQSMPVRQPMDKSTTCSLTDKVREFHLEEYRQVRSEMMGLLARIELLFRGAMVAAATVFAWLVVSSLGVEGEKVTACLKLPRELLWFAWLIPPTFVLCTGLMSAVAHRRVVEIGGYLRQLEQTLGYALLGWEAYLSRLPSVLTSMTGGLWWLLFILTTAATMVGLLSVEQAMGACSPR